MNKQLKTILGVGLTTTAAILFFIFVYLPLSKEKRTESKVVSEMYPSSEFKDPPVKRVPDFQFEAQTGDTVNNEFFKGDVVVADFFYTTCDAACPMMTTSLTRVQDALASNSDFRILSHTLDPAKDSISVLKKYAEKYDAKEGVWYFVTGDKETIYDLGEHGYMQSVLEEGESILNHSMRLILVDRNGMIRGFYDGTDSLEVNMLIHDASYLLYHGSKTANSQ